MIIELYINVSYVKKRILELTVQTIGIIDIMNLKKREDKNCILITTEFEWKNHIRK